MGSSLKGSMQCSHLLVCFVCLANCSQVYLNYAASCNNSLQAMKMQVDASMVSDGLSAPTSIEVISRASIGEFPIIENNALLAITAASSAMSLIIVLVASTKGGGKLCKVWYLRPEMFVPVTVRRNPKPK